MAIHCKLLELEFTDVDVLQALATDQKSINDLVTEMETDPHLYGLGFKFGRYACCFVVLFFRCLVRARGLCWCLYMCLW